MLTANTHPPIPTPVLTVTLHGTHCSAPHAVAAQPAPPGLTRGASTTTPLHLHDLGPLQALKLAVQGNAQQACHVEGVCVTVGDASWWFPTEGRVLGGTQGRTELLLKVLTFSPFFSCGLCFGAAFTKGQTGFVACCALPPRYHCTPTTQAASAGQHPPSRANYTLTITTGAGRGAGTDAAVWASLRGARRDSGALLLDAGGTGAFSRGDTDTCAVTCWDLGGVDTLELGTDGSGTNARRNVHFFVP